MYKIIKPIAILVILSNFLFANIDATKEIIRVGTINTLEETQKIEKELNIYDTYIYKTQDIKKSYYILYVINIDSKDMKDILKDVRRVSPSAYESSDKSKKYLINYQNTKKDIVKSNKIKVVAKPIVKNFFNIDKRVVRVGVFNNMEDMKIISKQLDIYDRYIYKTQDVRKPYYILYVINIDSKDMKDILKNVRKISPSAYESSDKSKYYLVENKNKDSVFLPSKLKKKLKKEIKKEIEEDGVFYLTQEGSMYKEENEVFYLVQEEILLPIVKKVIDETIKDEVITKPISKNTKIDRKYFIGEYVGQSNLTTKQNDRSGSIVLGTQPDTRGMSFGWELGYKFENNTFSTISYTQSNFDDIELYNYTLSYNKSFQNVYLNPYIGVVGGISYIKLTKSLIDGNMEDKEGKENIFGWQVGVQKYIDNNFTFFTQYQYLKVKYTTTIKSPPAESEISRENLSNLMIGIRWSF